MKKTFSILILLAVILPLAVRAAFPLTTVYLGTNQIPANSTFFAPGPGTMTNVLTITSSAVTTNSDIFTNTVKKWTYSGLYYVTNQFTNGLILFTSVDTRYTNSAWVTNTVITTNNYLANTTTTTTTTNLIAGQKFIDCSKSASLGLSLKYQLVGAGTSPVTLNLYKSLGGITSNSLPDFSIALAANGTNLVATNTTLTVGTANALFYSITNANASAVTNPILETVQKVNLP